MKRLVSALIAVATLASPSWAQLSTSHLTRKLVPHDGMVAYTTEAATSSPSVVVRITAEDRAKLLENPAGLAKLTAGVRTILGFENKEIAEIVFIGEAERKVVYGGHAAKASEWTLRPIDLSDLLAAHPNDSTKPAHVAGVRDAAITVADIEYLTEICVRAVEAAPDEPRFQFNLARVLLLHGLIEEALPYLEAASDAGHAGAQYYLSETLEDAEAARELRQAALSAGFDAAASPPSGPWDRLAFPPTSDELAGHPADPMKLTGVSGKSDEQVASGSFDSLFQACRSAVEANPNEPRFLFNLGRVLFLHGYTDDAADVLAHAAELGSAPAFAYLAKIEEDPQIAKGLLENSYNMGFTPALAMLAAMRCPHFEAALTAVPEEPLPLELPAGIAHPRYLKALYDRDFGPLVRDNPKSDIYIARFGILMREIAPELVSDQAGTALSKKGKSAVSQLTGISQEDLALFEKDVLSENEAIRKSSLTFSWMAESLQGGKTMRLLGDVERLVEQAQADVTALLEKAEPWYVAEITEGLEMFALNKPTTQRPTVEMPLLLHDYQIVTNWLTDANAAGSLGFYPQTLEAVAKQLPGKDFPLIRVIYKTAPSAKAEEYATFVFWYEKPPEGLAEIVAGNPGHPFRKFGSAAVTEPPCCAIHAREIKEKSVLAP